MNTKGILVGSLLAGALLALTVRVLSHRSPPGTAARRPLLETADRTAFYDVLDAHIEKEMRRLNMPGVSLAIVRGDKIVHSRGFGRERPNGTAPSPRTLFAIGSLTKSFTALAVMQLVEANKIELDHPVRRYLPWFRVADREASDKITVRHLLNQTSGISTSAGEIPLADFDDSPGAAERQARALANVRLTHPVGAAFEYSNSNYNLLGLVIEAVCGESYSDYFRKHILAPLDMHRTCTSHSVAKRNGLAVGHQYWFGIPVAVPNMPVPYGSLAGGGILSTADDMAHFLIAQLNGGRYGDAQILSTAGIDEPHRGVAELSVAGRSLGRYGMGWFADKLGQTRLLWHGGTLPDFAAFMALLPDQKQGVVLLCNASHHWMNPVIAEFGMGVTALLAGEQPTRLPFVRIIPWALRAQLVIAALPLAGIVTTLQLLRRLRPNSEHYSIGRERLGLSVFGALLPNFLAVVTLLPLLSKRRGYLMLYMPDYSWLALLGGSLAFVWSLWSGRQLFRILRTSRLP